MNNPIKSVCLRNRLHYYTVKSSAWGWMLRQAWPILWTLAWRSRCLLSWASWFPVATPSYLLPQREAGIETDHACLQARISRETWMEAKQSSLILSVQDSPVLKPSQECNKVLSAVSTSLTSFRVIRQQSPFLPGCYSFKKSALWVFIFIVNFRQRRSQRARPCLSKKGTQIAMATWRGSSVVLRSEDCETRDLGASPSPSNTNVGLSLLTCEGRKITAPLPVMLRDAMPGTVPGTWH